MEYWMEGVVMEISHSCSHRRQTHLVADTDSIEQESFPLYSLTGMTPKIAKKRRKIMKTPPPRSEDIVLHTVDVQDDQGAVAGGDRLPTDVCDGVMNVANLVPDEGGDKGDAVMTLECSYLPGGVCKIHGPGAKLKWKPIVGKNKKYDKKRHYFYKCDVEMTRGVKLKQTRLSFGSLKPSLSKKDTEQGYLG